MIEQAAELESAIDLQADLHHKFDRGIQPPEQRDTIREAMGLLEVPKLFWRWPQLVSQPRGAGEPIMVLPGYGTSDHSTWLLRSYLRALGYRPYGWGLGRNHGNVERLLPEVLRQIEDLVMETGAPLRLVGWSLGGYLAREAARDQPALVTQVITMGTPVVGGPKYTMVADNYRRKGIDVDAIEERVASRYEIPLQTPVTAIYSRNDGVVAWRACIDHLSPNVEHIEVDSAHIGLGFSSDVYKIIAAKLAGQPTSKGDRV